MPIYAELLPNELAALWKASAPAIVPWGALEWHGSHLPLGLDGMVAEAFAHQLSEQANGVLLPAIWLPITTLPHVSSLQVRAETMRAILDDVLGGLGEAGARTVAIVSGHYAQGHLIELYQAAHRAMEAKAGLRVFAATPLQPLGVDDLLDHAGRYETSQLLALRPELVRLENLPEEVQSRRDAVLGKDPRQGTVAEGQQLLSSGLQAWIAWLTSDREKLFAHYERETQALGPYVDAYYRGSWEDAILQWWKSA